MKNKNIALEILEQNYRIDTLVTFLGENNYYSDDISDKQRRKIAKKCLKLTEDVMTFKTKFPEELIEKRKELRQLNEGPLDWLKNVYRAIKGGKVVEAGKTAEEAGSLPGIVRGKGPSEVKITNPVEVVTPREKLPETPGGNRVESNPVRPGEEIQLAREGDVSSPGSAISAARERISRTEPSATTSTETPTIPVDKFEKIKEGQLRQLMAQVLSDYRAAVTRTIADKPQYGFAGEGVPTAPRIEDLDKVVMDQLKSEGNLIFGLPPEKQELLLPKDIRNQLLSIAYSGYKGKPEEAMTSYVLAEPEQIDLSKYRGIVGQTDTDISPLLKRAAELKARGLPVKTAKELIPVTRNWVEKPEEITTSDVVKRLTAEYKGILDDIEEMQRVIEGGRRRGFTKEVTDAEDALAKAIARRDQLAAEIGPLSGQAYYEQLKTNPEALKTSFSAKSMGPHQPGVTPLEDVNDIIKRLTESRFYSKSLRNKKKVNLNLLEQGGAVGEILRAVERGTEASRGAGAESRGTRTAAGSLKDIISSGARSNDLRGIGSLLDKSEYAITSLRFQRSELSKQVETLEELLKQAKAKNIPDSELKDLQDALKTFKNDLQAMDAKIGVAAKPAEATKATEASPLIAAARQTGKPIPSDVSKLSPEELAAVMQLGRIPQTSVETEVAPRGTGGLNTPASADELEELPLPTGGLNTPASVEETPNEIIDRIRRQFMDPMDLKRFERTYSTLQDRPPVEVSPADIQRLQGATEQERQRRINPETVIPPSQQVDIPEVKPAWERLVLQEPEPILNIRKLLDDLSDMQKQIEQGKQAYPPDLEKLRRGLEAERVRRTEPPVKVGPSGEIEIPPVPTEWTRLPVEEPKPIIDPTKLVRDFADMQDVIDRARPTGGLNTPASVEETPAETLARVIQSIMDPAGLNRFKKTYSSFDEIPQPGVTPSSPVVPVPQPKPVPYVVPNPVTPPNEPLPIWPPEWLPKQPKWSPHPEEEPIPQPKPKTPKPTTPKPTPGPEPEPGPGPRPNPQPGTPPNPEPGPSPQPSPQPQPQPEPKPKPRPLPWWWPKPDWSPKPAPAPAPTPQPVQPKPIPAPTPTPVPVPVNPPPKPKTPPRTPEKEPDRTPSPKLPPVPPIPTPPSPGKPETPPPGFKFKLPGANVKPSGSEISGDVEDIDVHVARVKLGSLGQGNAGFYRIV